MLLDGHNAASLASNLELSNVTLLYGWKPNLSPEAIGRPQLR